MNTTKNFFILIFMFLLIPLMVKSLIVLSGNWGYLNDEIIINDISSRNIYELLYMVKTEPHPPGVYLSLKLFPNAFVYPNLFKVSLIITNFIIWVLLLLYFLKFKLMNNFVFFFFALLFSTNFFVTSSFLAKMDFISLPLFIFFITNFYLYLRDSNNSYHIKIALITLIPLLFYGYIYYLQALFLSLVIITLYIKKISSFQNVKSLIGVLAITNLIYFSIYAYEQFLLNKDRFDWFLEYPNNFFVAYSSFISIPSKSLVFLSSVIFVTTLAIYALFLLRSKYRNFSLLIITILVGIIFFYSEFNLFVRSRYSVVLFLFILSLSAYACLKLFDSVKNAFFIKIMMIFFLLLLPSLLLLSHVMSGIAELKSELFRYTNEKESVGFLAQNNITPFILHRGYMLKDSVKPISKEVDTYSGKLTFEMINMGSYENKMNDLEIEKWLSSKELNTFIYIEETRPLGKLYDPQREVKSVLIRNCTEMTELKSKLAIKPILFEKCFW